MSFMILANLTLTIEILKVQLPIDLKTKIYDQIVTVCINGVMSIFGKSLVNFKHSLVANICQKKFSISLIIVLI